LLPEIMYVLALRKIGRVDFYYRADQNYLPMGARVGKRGEQRHIEAFVDNAVVSQPRAGYVSMRRMAIGGVPCQGKVGSIDAAGETVNVGMTLLLCPEEARPPRKHDICYLEQCFSRCRSCLGEFLNETNSSMQS
jgi:hypothetical protein